MRILLRADADRLSGTGHVMRCLTLAEELISRGHEAILVGDLGEVSWLRERVRRLGVPTVPVEPHSLSLPAGLAPDRVILDSYRIPPEDVSRCADTLPVMAIVDGDHRGIRARWILDQNLGAETRIEGEGPGESLLGSHFALVRREIVELRRPDPWRLRVPPRVLVVMGGTDPAGAIVPVAKAVSRAVDGRRAEVTVVVAEAWRREVQAAVAGSMVEVVAVTPKFAELLHTAQIVVTAAGTTAWDVCTLGLPSVLVAVVGNQRESVASAIDYGVAVGIDAAEQPERLSSIDGALLSLLDSEENRRTLTEACGRHFDGRGAERVVDRLVSPV